jgi:antirestriction protein ArdC
MKKPNKAIEVVTDRIIQLIEETGVLPWQKPWRSQSQAPRNIRGRQYSGINAMLLAYSGYSDKRFLTYRQATELGGMVRPGEAGWPVLFVRRDIYQKKLDDGTTEERQGYLLRYYTVFNTCQCEGIPKLDEPEINEEIIPCERIVKGYKDKPMVKHGFNHAHYIGAHVDLIEMPKRASFVNSESYYNVLFHELIHSTGHPKRLNREGVVKVERGSDNYRKEELIAEIGANGLDHMSGIYEKVERNSASYVASWLGKLKEDPSVLVGAARGAERAIDYMLGVTRFSSAEKSSEAKAEPDLTVVSS